MRACNVCAERKPLDGFFRCARFPLGRDYTCKVCSKARSALWRQANRDRSREIGRTSARANYDSQRSALAWAKWYATADKSHMYHRNAKRRSVEAKATPAWANEFFIEQAYDIARRRTEVTGISWEVDHIVPLQSKSVCGLHVDANLRVIPAAINRGKRNRHWPDSGQCFYTGA